MEFSYNENELIAEIENSASRVASWKNSHKGKKGTVEIRSI